MIRISKYSIIMLYNNNAHTIYIYDTYGHERDVVREFRQRPVNNFEQAPFPVTQFPKIFVFS